MKSLDDFKVWWQDVRVIYLALLKIKPKYPNSVKVIERYLTIRLNNLKIYGEWKVKNDQYSV